MNDILSVNILRTLMISSTLILKLSQSGLFVSRILFQTYLACKFLHCSTYTVSLEACGRGNRKFVVTMGPDTSCISPVQW
jgi:hypothetical protein